MHPKTANILHHYGRLAILLLALLGSAAFFGSAADLLSEASHAGIPAGVKLAQAPVPDDPPYGPKNPIVEPTRTPVATVTPMATSTPTPQPTETPIVFEAPKGAEQPIPMGTMPLTTRSWILQVTQMRPDADVRGIFSEIRPANSWLVVRVMITNRTGQQQTINLEDFKVIDQMGRAFYANEAGSFWATQDCGCGHTGERLRSGETKTFAFAFDVPAGETKWLLAPQQTTPAGIVLLPTN